MSELPQARMRHQLIVIALYGPEIGVTTAERLTTLISESVIPARQNVLSERDSILIAYGDHVQTAGLSPLRSLHQFLTTYAKDAISAVHILPFYPYSSDDGFSIIDYQAVDPALGTWQDISLFQADFKLMFDLVLNHASSHSAWFQAFLRNEAPYRDYFMTADPGADLSRVTRPRTHPLLTPYETSAGVRHIWTTFSADQVDLNFANPDVLLEIIRVMLFYVEKGADFVRLDAIAYLWKIPGTTCIHLSQTHRVVQLLRDVLDAAVPWVKLITETNVPHEENLSYFGDGTHEAQLIYNFALPPLILDALYSGSTEVLSNWASTLKTPSSDTTFFNFTASHDGIGIRPATGLLSSQRIQAIIETVQAHGGHISYKTNPDGSQSAYELNITYFDALSIPGEALSVSIDRFIVSQAIMLALAGIPGIYLNSLIGARNWEEGVKQTGRLRTINRQKFEQRSLFNELQDTGSCTAQVLRRYTKLLSIRRAESAFHPNGEQRILNLHPAVVAIERLTTETGKGVLTLHNVSDTSANIEVSDQYNYDLYGDATCAPKLDLRPYQVAWLTFR